MPEGLRIEAIKMHTEGLSLREIGRRLGVPPSTVRLWVIGATKRSSAERHADTVALRDRIRQMRADDMSMGAIAKELEISPSTVHEHLK